MSQRRRRRRRRKKQRERGRREGCSGPPSYAPMRALCGVRLCCYQGGRGRLQRWYPFLFRP
eukprot:2647672-Rhodomonas_salina.2